MKTQLIYTFDELKTMQKNCGTYAIARHMHKKGYSLKTALWLLTGRK